MQPEETNALTGRRSPSGSAHVPCSWKMPLWRGGGHPPASRGGGREVQTSDFVAAKLDEWGIEYRRVLGHGRQSSRSSARIHRHGHHRHHSRPGARRLWQDGKPADAWRCAPTWMHCPSPSCGRRIRVAESRRHARMRSRLPYRHDAGRGADPERPARPFARRGPRAVPAAERFPSARST